MITNASVKLNNTVRNVQILNAATNTFEWTKQPWANSNKKIQFKYNL